MNPQSSKRRTTTTVKTLLGGKVRLIRYNENPMLYARAYVQGGYITHRTLETSIPHAVKIAEEFFYRTQRRIQDGEQLREPLFADLVQAFIADPSQKQMVSAGQHENYAKKWSVLSRFFKDVRVSQVTRQLLDSIRNTRAEEANRYGKPLSANTIDKDMIFVRQVLRWGKEYQQLEVNIPPAPKRKGRFEISKQGRPYLTLEQYHRVTKRALENARAADLRRQHQDTHPTRGRKIDPERKWELYYFILICVGGALRSGEAYSLRWRDCKEGMLLNPDDSEEPTIDAWVLSKQNGGVKPLRAWILYGGYDGFLKLKARRPNEPADAKVFRYEDHADGFLEVLKQVELDYDRETGLTRNLRSLRTTSISLRLDKKPDIPDRSLETWARTSTKQIREFYDQIKPGDKARGVLGGVKPRKKAKNKSEHS